MYKISIGCDHAATTHREAIIEYLIKKGHQVTDYGTKTSDSVDYPDYAHPVAQDIEDQKSDFGVLLCGSANGVTMTANKHPNVRAALCWKDEIATLARQHNNANIICIPARYTTIAEAILFTETFLNTAFEGGRHENRVNKINCR
ncbi:MAG: ribose 5-phosphate isomerase B [Chitinophagaceae bacterium]|nr:MAG: RpiB/LacA/LacB family sugar-phosphate isomerase [Bacteroidetes bacterium OLB11]MCC6447606.1 ribose 5-phosphate isomerase B [Chitinophagaceae bacterium]HMN32420.1 ribose 5-phosphate isomerase B [Chitinophagaceae bacterium]